MKQAYERYIGDYNWELRQIEVLPHCKDVTEFGHTTSYQLIRRKIFFGLIPWTYWTEKRNIRWHDMPLIKYYECGCGEE